MFWHRNSLGRSTQARCSSTRRSRSRRRELEQLEGRELLSSVLSSPVAITTPGMTTPAGAAVQQCVFVTNYTNGTLRVDELQGTTWTWHDLGTPAKGVMVDSTPVAISYQYANGGPLHENVFVLGSNDNLYLD